MFTLQNTTFKTIRFVAIVIQPSLMDILSFFNILVQHQNCFLIFSQAPLSPSTILIGLNLLWTIKVIEVVDPDIWKQRFVIHCLQYIKMNRQTS